MPDEIYKIENIEPWEWMVFKDTGDGFIDPDSIHSNLESAEDRCSGLNQAIQEASDNEAL